MSTPVKPYYASSMSRADLDAFVAFVDMHGVKNCLLALADFVTQRNYGDKELSFVLGQACGIAHKFEKTGA
jgi:hypothetical protein